MPYGARGISRSWMRTPLACRGWMKASSGHVLRGSAVQGSLEDGHDPDGAVGDAVAVRRNKGYCAHQLPLLLPRIHQPLHGLGEPLVGLLEEHHLGSVLPAHLSSLESFRPAEDGRG